MRRTSSITATHGAGSRECSGAARPQPFSARFDLGKCEPPVAISLMNANPWRIMRPTYTPSPEKNSSFRIPSMAMSDCVAVVRAMRRAAAQATMMPV
eukprot:11873713-Heterocapsa_arctica.AAC.1